MKNLIKIWLFKFQSWLNRLLIKHIDLSESNEVVKVVTKKLGITWINMENHVSITNKFIIPYTLKEVKLTYYNDAGQNVGYLHYEGEEYIGAFANKVVKMPSKMSNITALFNMVRLMVVDDIKTRTVGTTTIKLLGMTFELPMDDIMIIDKDKVVMDEESDEDRATRLAAKSLKAKEREEKTEQFLQKKKDKLALFAEKRQEKKKEILGKIEARKEKAKQKRAARKRLKRMKSNSSTIESEPLQETVTPINVAEVDSATISSAQEPIKPTIDKSYLDQIT